MRSSIKLRPELQARVDKVKEQVYSSHQFILKQAKFGGQPGVWPYKSTASCSAEEIQEMKEPEEKTDISFDVLDQLELA